MMAGGEAASPRASDQLADLRGGPLDLGARLLGDLQASLRRARASWASPSGACRPAPSGATGTSRRRPWPRARSPARRSNGAIRLDLYETTWADSTSDSGRADRCPEPWPSDAVPAARLLVANHGWNTKVFLEKGIGDRSGALSPKSPAASHPGIHPTLSVTLSGVMTKVRAPGGAQKGSSSRAFSPPAKPTSRALDGAQEGSSSR
ncbi:unnamed protein product, partial [Prorocentrum cordatum]